MDSSQQSSSNTNPFVDFSQPFYANQVLPEVQNVANQYDPTGGQAQSNANAYYANELAGNNLYGNPALSNYLDATKTNYMDMATNSANQAAQNAAQTGMASSSTANTEQANAATNAAKQYAQLATGAQLQNYGQERQFQQQAAQQPLQQQQEQLNQLMQMLNLFKGGGTQVSSGSSSPSLFSDITGGIGAAAGLMAL